MKQLELNFREIKKFKYELEGWACLTNCPFEWEGRKVKIGSTHCVKNCERFISNDKKNFIVMCGLNK